jgi:hypothetical protein
MQSSHLIAQTEFAKSRRDELIGHAARQRLIQTATDGQERKTSTLRHRLGNLLVRSGERLQAANRSQPADDFGTSAGVLHLAR